MDKKEFYTRLGKAAYEYGALYEAYSTKINKRTDNFICMHKRFPLRQKKDNLASNARKSNFV